MWLSRPDASPQTQAYQFAACLETKKIGVYFAAMSDDQPAQHLNLLSLAGFVHLPLTELIEKAHLLLFPKMEYQ